MKEVRNGHPEIDVDGKLQRGYGGRFALMKTPFYLPGLVTLPKFVVKTYHLEMIQSAARLNYELWIEGRAKADVALKHCFFVLELTSWRGSNVVFAELPDLEAGREKAVWFVSPADIQSADRAMEGKFTYFNLQKSVFVVLL